MKTGGRATRIQHSSNTRAETFLNEKHSEELLTQRACVTYLDVDKHSVNDNRSRYPNLECSRLERSRARDLDEISRLRASITPRSNRDYLVNSRQCVPCERASLRTSAVYRNVALSRSGDNADYEVSLGRSCTCNRTAAGTTYAAPDTARWNPLARGCPQRFAVPVSGRYASLRITLMRYLLSSWPAK